MKGAYQHVVGRGWARWTFLFLIWLSMPAQAQHRCGTSLYNAQLAAQNPKLIEQWKQSEERVQQWMQNESGQPRTMVIIPVVVHVVWKTPIQNISDEQVQSQIDVLNEDFQRLNADTFNTPAPWKSVAGGLNVMFCLAKYDPQGNPTTGIVRVQTNVTAFGMGDSMKYSALGGSDGWPARDYLNIWVCNTAGNLLGYATMPSGPNPGPNDGVVVWYRAFGRTGTLSSKYNKGRTCTHEVGHWLGLRHIWGDDNGNCNGNDAIADTPNQADATYNCPTWPLFDNCSGAPNGIMFMNYMDYTDDACMNLFTKNQCTRMNGFLNNDRASLKNSPAGCQGIKYAHDASISAVLFPTDTLDMQSFEPQVQLSNRGSAELNYVKIFFRVDGQDPQMYEFHGSLPPLASQTLTLPRYFTGEGGHIAQAWTQDPNHQQDEFVFNDTASHSFLVKSAIPKNTTIVAIQNNGVNDQPLVTVYNPAAAHMDLSITNVMGQVIQRGRWPVAEQPSFVLDFSNQPAGIYLLIGQIGYDTVKKKILIVR